MGRKTPEATDVYVGQRVRTRRLELGLSQTNLAEKLGLTFQQVQKYEKGANHMGSSRLQQTAHILKVPVAFFFDGGPNSKVNGAQSLEDIAANAFLSTKEGMKVAQWLPRMQPKDRRAVIALIETLAT